MPLTPLPTDPIERERFVRGLVAAKAAAVGGFNSFAERPHVENDLQYMAKFGFTPPGGRQQVRALFVDFGRFADTDEGWDDNPKVAFIYQMRLVMAEMKAPYTQALSDAFAGAIVGLREAFRAGRDFGYPEELYYYRLEQVGTATTAQDPFLGIVGWIANFTLRVEVEPAC